MRTRYGLSPWIHGFPDSRRPAFPRLRGEETAEIAIIGGGLTGCAIAFVLASAGLRPLLIEAGRIGQASTGRSAGLLLPEPGASFLDVQRMHGLRASRTVFESWRRAALDGAALLRRANVKCAIEPADSVMVSATESERVLRREDEARTAAGLESGWLTAKQVRLLARLDAAGGHRLHGGATLDPYRACVGLATGAVARRARLFERTRVQKVRPTSKHVEVVVEGGIVRASTAIVATGMATAEFKPLRRHFKPRERYSVLTAPVPAAVRKHLVAEGVTLRDRRTPHHRIRWAADHRLLVSGADQDETPEKRREAVLVQRTGQLMYELLMMYPTISGLAPEYGWETAYGATADDLMYIGPHRNYPRHLFALGSDGDSITGAFLAARILARALQGQTQKGDDVFGWTR